MEVQDLPVGENTNSETPGVSEIQAEEIDRIAFELWQHGSVPDVIGGDELEAETVAGHASCL